MLVCIDEERDKLAIQESDLKDNDEDKQSKYQNIVYGQLMSIIYNMIEFKISFDSIKDFIDTNSKLNSLSEELHQSVIMTLICISEDNLKQKGEEQMIRESLIDENHFNSSLEVSFYHFHYFHQLSFFA